MSYLIKTVKKLLSIQSLRFTISSFIAFVIDYVILLTLEKLLSSLPLAMEIAAVAAFLISSHVNFMVNRRWVFHSDKNIWAEMGGYYGLALFSFSVKTFVLLELFVRLFGIPTWIAKPMAEVIMFIVNYFVQKKLIFKKQY